MTTKKNVIVSTYNIYSNYKFETNPLSTHLTDNTDLFTVEENVNLNEIKKILKMN